jgi:hypothetical protein
MAHAVRYSLDNPADREAIAVFFQQLEQDYRAGDLWALAFAVTFCVKERVPPPIWIDHAVYELVERRTGLNRRVRVKVKRSRIRMVRWAVVRHLRLSRQPPPAWKVAYDEASKILGGRPRAVARRWWPRTTRHCPAIPTSGN